MNVKEVRDIVEGMELSPEAMARIEEILGENQPEDDIPDATIDQILAIVDVEMDSMKLAADIYQSGADLANEFLAKVDEESNKIADEMETP